MSDQFNVVRTDVNISHIGHHNGPERLDVRIVDTLEVFGDFAEALKFRTEISSLAERLKMIGVSFSVQYGFEIQQVKTLAGITRKRLMNLAEYDDQSNQAADDAFFGESPSDLVNKTLKALTAGE